MTERQNDRPGGDLRFRQPVMDCMEALFAFQDALNTGEVTTVELEDVMRMAIASGHDMMMIGLTMALVALERSQGDKA